MSLFGNKLKEIRSKRGLTQSSFADLLNIKRSTYSLYESGKREPNIQAIREMSQILAISMDELVGWDIVESVINDELSRLDALTQKYIQVLEAEGYKIDLGSEDVDIIPSNKDSYKVTRKEFMSMIHYCHVDISANMDKLLRNYEQK